MTWLTDKGDGCDLAVKVTPRASRDRIGGERAGRLDLRVTAAPEAGRANAAAERLLADALGVAKTKVAVVAGHSARQKRVHVTGMSAAEVRGALAS